MRKIMNEYKNMLKVLSFQYGCLSWTAIVRLWKSPSQGFMDSIRAHSCYIRSYQRVPGTISTNYLISIVQHFQVWFYPILLEKTNWMPSLVTVSISICSSLETFNGELFSFSVSLLVVSSCVDMRVKLPWKR